MSNESGLIGFIAWQTVMGFMIVGYILGFATAVIVANILVNRERRGYKTMSRWSVYPIVVLVFIIAATIAFMIVTA